MKNRTRPFLALTALACLSHTAQADSVALPPMNLGNTSFLDGVAAPGFLFELGSSYYRATQLRDGAGHVNPASPRVEVTGVVPHIAYISPNISLLGGQVGAEVLLPLVYADIAPGPGLNERNLSAGDIQFSPFLIQWTGQTLLGKPFFQRFDLLFSAPTGQYNPDSFANAGSNAWTVTPYYAFTIMPGAKTEISGRLHYQWSGKNTSPSSALHAGSTQAGAAISLNLSASYAVNDRWRIGVAGYVLRQIGEDRIDGNRQTGSKERVMGAGPGLFYMGRSYQIFVNGYKEWGARNRTDGSKIVLRYLVPF